MRYFITILLVLTGCSESATELTAWQKAMRDGSVEAIEVAKSVEEKTDESIVILKENTTALAAIKGQVESLSGSVLETQQALGTMNASLVKTEAVNAKEVIQSAVEPQEPTRPNPSHTSKPVALPPAVRLYVSHAPFHCPPCERLKRAVANGEFDGFEVVDGGSFSGLRSYPAIRFETPTTTTGWGVLYGYDSNTISTLRALTGAIKEQPITLIDRGTRSPVVRIKSTRRGLFGMFR